LRELLATEPLIVTTRETALRAGFDSLAAQFGLTPVLAAEVDDMAMIRLLARANAGLAIIPPIVVQDELQSGTLVEAARLDGMSETFLAVTRQRRFPNPLLQEVLRL
jgi:LysR family transcriptional activator of nhaA